MYFPKTQIDYTHPISFRKIFRRYNRLFRDIMKYKIMPGIIHHTIFYTRIEHPDVNRVLITFDPKNPDVLMDIYSIYAISGSRVKHLIVDSNTADVRLNDMREIILFTEYHRGFTEDGKVRLYKNSLKLEYYNGDQLINTEYYDMLLLHIGHLEIVLRGWYVYGDALFYHDQLDKLYYFEVIRDDEVGQGTGLCISLLDSNDVNIANVIKTRCFLSEPAWIYLTPDTKMINVFPTSLVSESVASPFYDPRYVVFPRPDLTPEEIIE